MLVDRFKVCDDAAPNGFCHGLTIASRLAASHFCLIGQKSTFDEDGGLFAVSNYMKSGIFHTAVFAAHGGDDLLLDRAGQGFGLT